MRAGGTGGAPKSVTDRFASLVWGHQLRHVHAEPHGGRNFAFNQAAVFLSTSVI
jgi:hypothetical protein